MEDESNPSGLCRCGCGKITPIARRNRWDLGHVKGQHVPYLPSHNSARRGDPNRFWDHVRKDPETGCWIREKITRREDFGAASIEVTGRVVGRPSHIAWILTHGEIPEGLFVCHTCDNNPCCNPDHLFLGTHQDNMDDAAKKGRMTNAKSLKVRWPSAMKPTREEVEEIRRRYTEDSSWGQQKVLAEEFGYHKARIQRILRSKDWKHEYEREEPDAS